MANRFLITLFVSAKSLFLQIAQAQPLSFEITLKQAVEHSPKIRQFHSLLQAQSHKHTASWLELGPTIIADYNQVYFKNEQTAQFGNTELVVRPKETQTASITASQAITGLFAKAELAKLEGEREDNTELQYQLIKSEIAFSTSEAFLNLKKAESMVKVANESVAASKSQASDALVMHKAGRIHQGDLLKIQLAAANAQSTLAKTEARLIAAKTTLKMLIGSSSIEAIELADEDINFVEPVRSQTSDINNRKDIKLATSQIKIIEFGKKAALTQFMPSINAFAKIDHNLLNPSGFGGDGDKTTRTYGITASWLIWNNGARIYKYREALQQIEAAKSNASVIIEQAKNEITIANANLNAAKVAFHFAKATIEQARESYRIEQERFKAGAANASDLLLAEASHTNAEGSYINAATDFKLAVVHLQKALGYNWPKTVENKP